VKGYFFLDHLVLPRLVDVQIATLTAVDYDGNRRTLGGDPVTVKLIGPLEETQHNISNTVSNHLERRDMYTTDDCIRVLDKKNGQYIIRLCSSACGRYIYTNRD